LQAQEASVIDDSTYIAIGKMGCLQLTYRTEFSPVWKEAGLERNGDIF